MSQLRNGPCAPWTSSRRVLELPWVKAAGEKAVKDGKLDSAQIELIAAESAMAASEILYELSGRTFTGECGPVTVRPVSRPTDIDSRGSGTALGWLGSWGMCSSYGAAPVGILSHYGCSNPPEIELGAYPVTSIKQVLIDGVSIPANEYELRDHRWLVRMRPTAAASPTQRWGWPTCQIQDLPDTQPGTFSVTYEYGQPAPAAGQLAALKLAEFLTLPQLGDQTRYPQRVTQVARQGVTTQTTDVMNILKSKSLGIYEVDAFLLAVNPNRNHRQAAVWSPDVGRPRRTASPSLPT